MGEFVWSLAQILKSAERPSLRDSVEKLAMVGQQAGFTVQQMIDLLNSGVTVDTLLDLFVWRIDAMTRDLKDVTI